nr:MAG TPA: hypothetical protein [Caudoviricetes sp.]
MRQTHAKVSPFHPTKGRLPWNSPVKPSITRNL